MAATRTHEMVILDRKPDDAAIRRMVHEYFDAEAVTYDQFTQSTAARQRFVDRMNALIASDLQRRGSVDALLSIACGTGSRERAIRAHPGRSFTTVGVDSSAAMCAAARRAGVETIQSAWLDADLGEARFDAALYLYSLGMAPSKDARLAELAKIAQHLKPGAPFYVDVLNLDDRNEWGPEICRVFADQNLGGRGYEPGDTFYRRIGGKTVTYFHYFERQEAEDLLARSGFRIAECHYIDCGRNAGELVGPEEGAMLFVALRV